MSAAIALDPVGRLAAGRPAAPPGGDCYHRSMFQVIEPSEHNWIDAATWPEPSGGADLGDVDEVTQLKRRERHRAISVQVQRTARARTVRGRLP